MPEGEHRRPDPLFVPVRVSHSGVICLRTGRLASGLAVGLAFSSQASLLAVFGTQQRWALICERALLDMLAPLGIDHLRIDPMLAGGIAPAAPDGTRSGAQRPPVVRSRKHQASRHRHCMHRCSEHIWRQRQHARKVRT
jgi:hypothetical protein